VGLRPDDRALVGRPLDSLAGPHRRGASDMGKPVHYFRLTRDNGGCGEVRKTVTDNGGRRDDDHATRPATFLSWPGTFFTMFPQLEGVRVHARVGGVIDTCISVPAFLGERDRQAAYAAG